MTDTEHTCFETKTVNGPTSAKIPWFLTDVTIASTFTNIAISTHSGSSCFVITYRLSFEWLPHDGPIHDGIFGQTTPRKYASFRDVICIHHADDVIISGAAALHII